MKIWVMTIDSEHYIGTAVSRYIKLFSYKPTAELIKECCRATKDNDCSKEIDTLLETGKCLIKGNSLQHKIRLYEQEVIGNVNKYKS